MAGVCEELIRYLCLAACEVCVGIASDCATYRRDCTPRLCQCCCCCSDSGNQDYPSEREALLAEDRFRDDRMTHQSPTQSITQTQPSPTQPPQTTQ
ncbi:hypothetical protein RSOLAG1IB_01189 [Rhizoctonia solani AG-1 IB]|uniref:Uncharacterized protein n=1 Tax=Thanatephorus cucumeris (strain AG1-IB / isolate 7/3/14) TaxID=1108050 RepID=A0A0B7FAV3_THACB|nr:hypothetical protein RSOLAG1IB_01189 [Rhizoctonia solani AG-1 IB]